MEGGRMKKKNLNGRNDFNVKNFILERTSEAVNNK